MVFVTLSWCRTGLASMNVLSLSSSNLGRNNTVHTEIPISLVGHSVELA